MEKHMRRGEDFYRTGVFIREDDYREVLEMTEVAKRTPVKHIKGHERVGLHSTFRRQAWSEVQAKIHSIALKMGLDALPSGKYGLAKNGEFILPEDADMEPKAKKFMTAPKPDFEMDEVTADDVERFGKLPESGEANPFDEHRPMKDMSGES